MYCIYCGIDHHNHQECIDFFNNIHPVLKSGQQKGRSIHWLINNGYDKFINSIILYYKDKKQNYKIRILRRYYHNKIL